jgi:hypothetical protein
LASIQLATKPLEAVADDRAATGATPAVGSTAVSAKLLIASVGEDPT